LTLSRKAKALLWELHKALLRGLKIPAILCGLLDLLSGGNALSLWTASLLVVSDIHLNHVDDERSRRLIEMLEGVSRSEVEYLVLMGDIFDFCLGSHPYFQKKFAAIGQVLEKVAASGTRVIYLEGNHEFKLASLPWKDIQVISEGTHVIRLKSGETVQMAHGDLIYSHNTYKRFRRFVKSPFVTGIARLLPGAWMDKLATTSSEVSRSQDQYRLIQHDRILGAVDAWLEHGSADYGIFGHFHVPYAEPRRDGKAGGVFSVESWDHPNVLGFKDGRFFRYFFEESAGGTWVLAEPLVRQQLPPATVRS
jgi:UDP-2,3-diacylglucosamine hydrolase